MPKLMEESHWISRRRFVKNMSLAGISFPLAINSPFKCDDKLKKLVILHTNDIHSHIDPFPENSFKYPSKGGMTRIAALINKIKGNESNVLLLDAGDIFQGTIYFNRFKGVVELQIMSHMGYAASTMGNHDFDNGLDGFNKIIHHAKFPFLCSNYDFSSTVLRNKTQPFLIKKIKNLKIGIFGIGVQLDGLVEKKNYAGTKYLDPIKSASYWAKYLKKTKKCQLIICLSHLGFNYLNNRISDVILAKNSKYIDIIIGGHTHTFLEKSIVIKNKIKKDVIVNQAGWGALSLGRIDLIYEDKNMNLGYLRFNNARKKNYAKI